MRAITAIVSTTLFLLIAITAAQAATIQVPADYLTIQAAIDAASSGDTIVIATGNYEEQLLIDGKDIALQGAGVGSTVLQSPEILDVSFNTGSDNKCIIGIINGADCAISDMTIDGLGRGNSNVRFEGIGFRNSGGTVTDCEILDVRDTPLSGAQHGVAVYAYNDNGTDFNIDLVNCYLEGYQKTGMALSGENVIATVTGCTTAGAGQTTVTAQNGIQLAYGASGTVDGCTVTGHCYTGGYWTATGILLYDGGVVDVIDCPDIGDNQTGAYFITTSGSFSGNTITAGVNAQGDDGYYYGLGLDDLGDHQPQVSVFGDGEKRAAGRSHTTVNVSDCTFDADQTGHGIGIGAWAMAEDNLETSVTSCRIAGWETGIDVWDDGTALPTVQVFGCDIFDNTEYGIYNSTTSVVIAQYNWWGHESGPYNLLWNPTGEGDNVTDLVWFWPWLESADYLTVPWDYTTIQAAIDAAPEGGTVIVSPGSYEEQLFVDGKSVSVLGAGKGNSILLSPETLAVSFTTSAANKCIVGVINGGYLTIDGMTIDGQGRGNSNYRFNGIGFYNTGGEISNCEILNLQDTPFSGAQHGLALYAFNDDLVSRKIKVTDSEFLGYQKTGMVLSGEGLLASVKGCTLAGIGQTAITAQNGIQIGYDARGDIDDCTVSGHCYTGGTWTASGILLYDAETVDITDCMEIADNQTGVYYIDTNGTFSGCTLTAGVSSHGQSGTYWGLVAGGEGSKNGSRGAANVRKASAFDEAPRFNASRKPHFVTIENSTFLADTTGEGYALVGSATWGNRITMDVTDCSIQDWALGVYAYTDGSVYPFLSLHDCDIVGNDTLGGIINDTTNPIDAVWNWWGHPTGPYHPTLNPAGQGNLVSDFVKFKPFKYLTPDKPDFFQTLSVPDDFPSIQSAVDASLEGDVISVAAGNYEEQISIDGKSVHIMGDGIGRTNILSPALLDTSFVTSSDNKCVVAVINGGDLTMRNVTVDGRGYGNDNNKFSGIGFRNAGGMLVKCEVLNIQDTPFSGAQHGVGIYAYNNDGTDREVVVKHCVLESYQKTGMALNGENVIATVTGCTTDGVGPTSVTAQNGIQLGFGATGTIDGCSVSGHCYTGASWTATGILLYDDAYASVENCPAIADNQTGVYFVTTSGTYDNNTLTAGVNSQGQDGSYVGLGIDAHGEQWLPSSPFATSEQSNGSRSGTTVTVSGSRFFADQSGQGSGVGCWAQLGDDIVVDLVDCEIRNWNTGVDVWDDGTAVPTVDIFNCSLTGNTDFAVENWTSTLVTAEYNWWGDPTGPYHPDTNPGGLGDSVEGFVWIWNWLSSDPWSE